MEKESEESGTVEVEHKDEEIRTKFPGILFKVKIR